MAYQRKRRRLMGEINVVPYIDVTLVLLVIFMITAPMLTQGVKVELPRTEAEPASQSESRSLVVEVDAEGQYFLTQTAGQRQAVDEEMLLARTAAILRLEPKTSVYVGGDRTVAYDHVLRAMALLQRAGAPSVGLLTDPPEK